MNVISEGNLELITPPLHNEINYTMRAILYNLMTYSDTFLVFDSSMMSDDFNSSN